jgi:hypothetical protein
MGLQKEEIDRIIEIDKLLSKIGFHRVALDSKELIMKKYMLDNYKEDISFYGQKTLNDFSTPNLTYFKKSNMELGKIDIYKDWYIGHTITLSLRSAELSIITNHLVNDKTPVPLSEFGTNWDWFGARDFKLTFNLFFDNLKWFNKKLGLS